MINQKPAQQVLKWLLTTTRGGNTRIQILKTLIQTPRNTNQLATHLKKSDKTIIDHLTVLEKHKLVIPMGDNYGTTYFLTQAMEENYALLQD
jgi:predicted transcriptional regulator